MDTQSWFAQHLDDAEGLFVVFANCRCCERCKHWLAAPTAEWRDELGAAGVRVVNVSIEGGEAAGVIPTVADAQGAVIGEAMKNPKYLPNVDLLSAQTAAAENGHAPAILVLKRGTTAPVAVYRWAGSQAASEWASITSVWESVAPSFVRACNLNGSVCSSGSGRSSKKPSVFRRILSRAFCCHRCPEDRTPTPTPPRITLAPMVIVTPPESPQTSPANSRGSSFPHIGQGDVRSCA
eukprot:TRINITY_DN32092_c0_g1_i1.p1 TRINITY_DN32092_c0_g1~~TRINITY_DN32092_c0_g1_i1.p1  ORF type:complete len:237 (+),score=26.30 TRINITY_DN32092_c0_g1_i1:31-741(+)